MNVPVVLQVSSCPVVEFQEDHLDLLELYHLNSSARNKAVPKSRDLPSRVTRLNLSFAFDGT